MRNRAVSRNTVLSERTFSRVAFLTNITNNDVHLPDFTGVKNVQNLVVWGLGISV